MSKISLLLILIIAITCQIFAQSEVVEAVKKIPNASLRKRVEQFVRSGIEKALDVAPNADSMAVQALSYLHSPYRSGGITAKGMDCSGLLFRCATDLHTTIPHSSQEIARYGKVVANQEDLRRGDLLFFGSSKSKTINHSAIYLGDGQFIHMSSSQGCSIAHINDPHWQSRYIFATRLYSLVSEEGMFPFEMQKLVPHDSIHINEPMIEPNASLLK